MVGSDENLSGVISPTTNLGGGKLGAVVGENRKALSEIDKNIIRAPPAYPYAVSKRGANLAGTFAAQLARKPMPLLPEEKNPKVQKVNSEDDYEGADDFNAPMFVQHTEAMLEEIDKMDEEVEMEDVSEEPCLDIDGVDKENPLAVVEYVDEIYAHYRKQEISSCVSPMYMSQQYDITERMRGILIDWLIEVHYKFDLREETLYLTVNLIDRFLERQTVVRKKLQLVGVTAMLLACKYEEVYVPVVEDFIVISDKAYTRTEVLDMEKAMVNTLQFNLSVPTLYVFTKRFLKASQSHKELELLTFYLIELCLVEYEMLKFSPSLLSAAAVFTAQCTLGTSKQWTKTSEIHSNYSEYHLLECSKMMVSLHQKAGAGKLVAVYKKYGMLKYGHVAHTRPAHFMLESRFWD